MKQRKQFGSVKRVDLDAAKRIVHLSNVHPATDTRIFEKECQSLVKAGYDVTLIARAGNDAVIKGVRVRALRGSNGNRFKRMTRGAWNLTRMAFAEHGDAYHFHDPELIPVGLLLKLCGKRVIYDVHENVAKQMQSKFWIPSRLRTPIARTVRMLEKAAAGRFDGIVVATPGIAEVFPGSKTVVVQNYALLEEFITIDSHDYVDRNRIAAYVGGLTRARGIVEMVDAMRFAGANASLFVGGVFAPPELKTELETRPGYKHVSYLGWLSREEIRNVLSKSRLGLLVLHPEPNYLDAYPVKLFEYMAAGLPVIASNFPFWEQFVKDQGAGLMVDPLDPDAIANAIVWLLDHPEEADAMGQRGRQAVLAEYNWDQEAQKLLDMYSNILDG